MSQITLPEAKKALSKHWLMVYIEILDGREEFERVDAIDEKEFWTTNIGRCPVKKAHKWHVYQVSAEPL